MSYEGAESWVGDKGTGPACRWWACSNPSVPLSWVLVGLWVPEPGLPWAEPHDSRND